MVQQRPVKRITSKKATVRRPIIIAGVIYNGPVKSGSSVPVTGSNDDTRIAGFGAWAEWDDFANNDMVENDGRDAEWNDTNDDGAASADNNATNLPEVAVFTAAVTALKHASVAAGSADLMRKRSVLPSANKAARSSTAATMSSHDEVSRERETVLVKALLRSSDVVAPLSDTNGIASDEVDAVNAALRADGRA